MKRRLALKSEYVAELTSDELSRVAAGVTLTGYYPTLDARCLSVLECFEVVTIRSVNSPCPTL